MKMFVQQFRWQLVILARNNIILLSVVVTAIYAIIFYALKGLPNMDKVLTLLILNDPAIIGRIEDDLFVMDPRTIQKDELSIIETAFENLTQKA